MKKSEHYRIAQLAVLSSNTILSSTKLEIIHTLMGDEDLEKFKEKRDDEVAAEKEQDDG